MAGPATSSPLPAPFAAREAAEALVLASCTAPDFEVLECLGGGSNGYVFLVRCLAAGHPFPHKLYALKAVKNYANLTSRRLQVRYEAEFDLMTAIGPDPLLVRHWVKIVDAVPEAMIALMTPFDQQIMKENQAASADGAVHTMFALFDYHPQTLEDWLKGFRLDGPSVLPLAEFVPKARQVMRAFCVLEERNVLHRDVKADNVLVKQDGCVCICDFGEAYASRDGSRVLHVPSTFAGGNLAHQAPEVLNALSAFVANRGLVSTVVNYTNQAVFEVGVLLWEMAAGDHPVPLYPTTDAFTPEAVCAVSPAVQAQLDDYGYPPGFVMLVRRMVAYDAGTRPSLAAALQQFEVLFDPAFAALQAELDAARARAVAAEAGQAAAVARANLAEVSRVAAIRARSAIAARVAVVEAARDAAVARAMAVETFRDAAIREKVVAVERTKAAAAKEIAALQAQIAHLEARVLESKAAAPRHHIPSPVPVAASPAPLPACTPPVHAAPAPGTTTVTVAPSHAPSLAFTGSCPILPLTVSHGATALPPAPFQPPMTSVAMEFAHSSPPAHYPLVSSPSDPGRSILLTCGKCGNNIPQGDRAFVAAAHTYTDGVVKPCRPACVSCWRQHVATYPAATVCPSPGPACRLHASKLLTRTHLPAGLSGSAPVHSRASVDPFAVCAQCGNVSEVNAADSKSLHASGSTGCRAVCCLKCWKTFADAGGQGGWPSKCPVGGDDCAVSKSEYDDIIRRRLPSH